MGPKQWCLLLCLLCFASSVCNQELELNFSKDFSSASICDFCVCDILLEADGRKQEIYCGNTVDNLKDLTGISWPKNENSTSIHVLFENIELTTIHKISENEDVVSISFINNGLRSILPGAFANVPNLKYLKIAENELTMITPEVFKNLSKLEVLDLSDNKLGDFVPSLAAELHNLKALNLANNLLPKIPIEALQNLASLEELNLRGNLIYFVNIGSTFGENEWLHHLKLLDLSHNKISAIYLKDTFQEATSLEHLNLSSNAIVAIDSNLLSDCISLRVLDVSNNALSELSDLPPSITELYLHLNTFKKWPTISNNLKVLDLSKNNLYESYDENYFSFESLEHLNISGNSLSVFEITRPLLNLQSLDLSYNALTKVPQSLSIENMPNLSDFYIDGNPIDVLEFPTEIELKKLSAKYLNKLQSLNAASFSKIKVKSEETVEGCLDIMVSHCPNLEEINEATFQGVKLCHLDISYNNLSYIDQNIAEWSNIPGGVNLQGNPWLCTCRLQWMLDIILNDLYQNHPTYLHELRCALPRAFRGMRLVHWYNRGEKTFCADNHMARYVLLESSESEPVVLTGGGAVIGMLVAIVVGLILCIALIVYLVRGKYRHDRTVRRQMMKKRQAMSDAKIINSANRTQNVPLKV